MADILQGTSTLLIEDDPYGDLRYAGSAKSSFKAILPANTILLGSFFQDHFSRFEVRVDRGAA